MQKISRKIEQLNLPSEITECFSKLSEALEKTDRDLVVRTMDSLPDPGMSAGCILTERFFGIAEKESEVARAKVDEIIKKDVFRSLIHEAYHGILLFIDGFFRLEKRKGMSLTEEEEYIITRIRTLIDDIIVNHRVNQKGFPKFGQNFIPFTKKIIESIDKNQDTWFSPIGERLGEKCSSKFRISRYITTWAIIRFFKLEDDELSLLGRFLTRFRNNYLADYRECKEIIKIFNDYDVFKIEDHKLISEKIAEMWQIKEKIEMVRYIPLNN